MKVNYLKFIAFISTLLLSRASAETTCAGQIIRITAVDTAEENVVIRTEELKFDESSTLLDISIGDPDVLGQLLKPEIVVLDEGLSYSITFKPIQTYFTDIVDFDKFTYFLSSPSQGLLINVAGRDQIQCAIRLEITDTNNREPVFDRTEDMSFTITSASTETLLNWKFDDRLYATDQDLTKGTLNIISSDTKLRGSTTLLSDDHPFKFEIQLFASSDLEFGTHTFTITPNDGENDGNPLRVEINVEEKDMLPPRFKNEEYYIDLPSIPAVGDPLPQVIEAYDPDEELEGNMKRGLSYEVVNSEIQLTYDAASKKLVVGEDVSKFADQTKDVTVKATQDGTGKTAEVNVKIKFPSLPLPVFSEKVYVLQLTEWPTAGYQVTLQEPTPALGDDGSIYEYHFIETVDGIKTDANVLTFDKDLEPESLGRFKDNGVIMFEMRAFSMKAVSTDDYASANFVITLPRNDWSTTETPCECTTGNPTTETCPPCPTTDDPTCSSSQTDFTCPPPEPCPSTDATCPTPEPCPSTDATCPPSEPCPTTDTTCPPPEPCPTTDATCPPPEPCECTSGNPTTETCPPCQTTDDPICSSSQTDFTCPPPEPCPSTCPPPEPCECTSGNPTTETCPPCQITDDPICSSSSTNPTSIEPCPSTCPPPEPCPSTLEPPECPPCSSSTTTNIPCTPEPCDCPTSPTTCPTPPPCNTTPGNCQPCDQKDEEDDCSNTGLMVAVITTSVLCAASILAGGYCLWLLRKATVNPSRFSRESLLSTPGTEPPATPPPQSSMVQDKRLSFGAILTPTRFVSPEPGYQNPGFVDTPEVVPTSPVTPAVITPPITTTTATTTAAETTPAPKEKSIMKPPKEIEPDYEELPGDAKTPSTATESQGEPSKPAEKPRGVQFSPEDDYASVGGSDAGGGGAGNADEVNLDGASDAEDERL